MNNTSDQITALQNEARRVSIYDEPRAADYFLAAANLGIEKGVAGTLLVPAAMLNAPVGRLPDPTLAEKAAIPGRVGKKARALMASGKYTGPEKLSNQSGRWEVAK